LGATSPITMPTRALNASLDPNSTQYSFSNDPSVSVTYDPVAKSYNFTSTNTINIGPRANIDALVTQADIAAAKSDASYTVYEKTAGGKTIEVKLFNPAATNPTLALRYTSFADVVITGSQNGATVANRYYVPFGISTAAAQMPRSGSGNFAGIVVGRGRADAVASAGQVSSGTDVLIDGTSKMNVNWGTSIFTMQMNLNASNPANNAQASLGLFDWAGNLATAAFGGGTPNSFNGQPALNQNATGNMAGYFYGPAADEFGAIFHLNQNNFLVPNSPIIDIVGITVGKKCPTAAAC
jgi:C-lobe and N-lobe beta barrels of Tf-binding protein B